MLVVPMQDIQDFNSNYYESNEYLDGRGESSCEGGSEDGEHDEAPNGGGGVDNLV